MNHILFDYLLLLLLLLLYIYFSLPPFWFLSLWNSHSSASVDTAFSLAFISLSSKRVLPHNPEQDGRPRRVLPTWEQRWVRENRIAWSCFTHWWSEWVRWAQSTKLMRANKRYDANKHPPHHSSHSFTLTSSLMQRVIPVFTPSDC